MRSNKTPEIDFWLFCLLSFLFYTGPLAQLPVFHVFDLLRRNWVICPVEQCPIFASSHLLLPPFPPKLEYRYRCLLNSDQFFQTRIYHECLYIKYLQPICKTTWFMWPIEFMFIWLIYFRKVRLNQFLSQPKFWQETEHFIGIRTELEATEHGKTLWDLYVQGAIMSPSLGACGQEPLAEDCWQGQPRSNTLRSWRGETLLPQLPTS